MSGKILSNLVGKTIEVVKRSVSYFRGKTYRDINAIQKMILKCFLNLLVS